MSSFFQLFLAWGVLLLVILVLLTTCCAFCRNEPRQLSVSAPMQATPFFWATTMVDINGARVWQAHLPAQARSPAQAALRLGCSPRTVVSLTTEKRSTGAPPGKTAV